MNFSSLPEKVAALDLFTFWPIAVIVLIVIYTATQSAHYLTVSNFENILAINAPLGIIAMGQTTLLVSAGLDLSVGYNISFSSIVTGEMLTHGYPLWICIAAGLGAATAVGLVNGILCAQNRAHPFIITLGMSILLFGLCVHITGGAPVNNMGGLYTAFSGYLPQGFPFFGLPNLTIPLVATVLFAFCFLRWTPLGRAAFAIGGNEEAAYLSGIRIKWSKIALYTLMGFIVGIAAMCLAGEINEASFNLGQNYELQSIAASVIGGTALFGGRGGAFRSLQGVALLGIVNNAVVFSGLDPNFQQVVLGGIIILAVMVTRRQR